MGVTVSGRTVLVKRRLHTKGGWWVPCPCGTSHWIFPLTQKVFCECGRRVIVDRRA